MRQIEYGAAYGPAGSAESMRVLEGSQPVPALGEVLIQVEYAGVNRPDVLQRSGRYPPPLGASPILGLEVAGRVAALGAEVSGWQIGDAVCALVPGGGYAEYCVAPAAHVLAVPTGFSMAEAAVLPETWFTVWANLMGSGVACRSLQAGERILIHGGASGIGLTAIQLARHVGAEVFVTVGSEEKVRFCQDFGAQHVIHYRQQDFLSLIHEQTANEGVDVVLDMVGGAYLQKNVKLLRRDGRLVMIAFLEGSRVEFDFMPVMMKRLTLTGSTMRARSVREKAAICEALREQIWPLWSVGQLKPHICATFALEQADVAHRLMESNQHIGKIVLKI